MMSLNKGLAQATRSDETVAVVLEPQIKVTNHASPGRHMVTFYRSLSTMLDAGVPLFAIFEFLSRDGEHPELCRACGRVARRLVDGQTLHHATSLEPHFFSPKATRMMEAGYLSGTLSPILKRLATDEERAWRLHHQVKSQLMYPLWIALFGMMAIILLPPLVLTDLLETVVKMTSEPPALTRFLLDFSAILGSSWFIGSLTLAILGGRFLWRTPKVQEWLSESEPLLWQIPALGPLWQDIVSLRFLRVFSMSYEAGMAATVCLKMSASASGSLRAHQAGRTMKKTLVGGATLKESLEAGEFLPPITLEAVEAGEQVGKVADMMDSAAEMLEAEVESRIHAVSKLVEPIVLTVLGIFVGVFAVGCLLPIINLTESL